MITRTIMMPFRKPPHEVMREEQTRCHTWLVTEEWPETIREAIIIMLRREQRGDLGALMPWAKG